MSACARAAVALAAALLAGCADGFFAPGAPPEPRADVALSTTLASDSALFESVNSLRVRVTSAAGVLLDSTLAFRSAGRETRVHLAVELDNAQQSVAIDVELRAAGQALFRGVASAMLKRGETTPVPIVLTRVPAAVLPARVPAPEARPASG